MLSAFASLSAPGKLRSPLYGQDISRLDFCLRGSLYMKLCLFFGINDHRLVINLFDVQFSSPFS